MFLVARHKILGLCRHRTFQDAIVCLRDSDHVKASHGRHDLNRQAYSLDSNDHVPSCLEELFFKDRSELLKYIFRDTEGEPPTPC